ncbi:ABC transporter permease [Treponema phagedenis]|uniref:ABC transporter permease n=1 Tax=Treponema phagedenis TaxID=162 RepID=A0A0B7GTR7_TREPH|nr:ABC transporter [Treponema phagedenis]NVP25154.1 ABC transporter permease [Treponema phagedenis]QEJ96028.1 ABC transporter permease [Treponema phagedenis]QEJ97268.1 ABC transporter permease [Treponema phagedenis]QEK01792.1 ABC transporter permease [Treponema phagedenis]QEK02539.1 ABC transporter permease [Treponema phagedenis]
MEKIRIFLREFGWPRVIIFLFLLSLFIVAPFVDVSIGASLKDLINRFGMNSLMVLALVPMIQAGCGLNFGLSLGIIGGLLGSTLAMQTGAQGAMGFTLAIIFSVFFSSIIGWAYGIMLNRVKGEEMTIALYIGFAAVMFMSIMWILLPYSSANMVWAYAGRGLRTTISLEGFWDKILSTHLVIKIQKFEFPLMLILFVSICFALMKLFMHTKTGTAITAVGSNPEFARASGINIERARTISTIVSTATGGVGILLYQQSFGFIQLYQAPLFMPFPAVAAILIGGASVNKASILNVIIGTLLFQGVLTMTPSVINSILQTDMSEVIRIVLSNGMILYALTRKTQVTR